jgi:xylulose-5-phosphate/fructose-6-phosphate phosphoketolase
MGEAMENPLTNKELELMNAYWRACNYLSVGMIYLKDNPLLKEPLKTERCKTPAARALGREPGAVFCLDSSQSNDRQA